MRKIILIVSIALILILIGALAFSGFFAQVEIIEKEIGPFVFVGKEYVGDYKKSGTHQDSIYKDLISKGFSISDGFGIYRDNPEKVPVDECRSMLGCILLEKDTLRLGELERSNYLIQRMNKTNCMVVEFPYRNSLSILASVLKVYPALNEYISEKSYIQVPSLEIYTKDKIIVSMEIRLNE